MYNCLNMIHCTIIPPSHAPPVSRTLREVGGVVRDEERDVVLVVSEPTLVLARHAARLGVHQDELGVLKRG